MSNIFDALQRSEAELSGGDHSLLLDATELLRRVELRTASKWVAPAQIEQPRTSESSGQVEPLKASALPSGAIDSNTIAAGEKTFTADELGIFHQFQQLPISITDQSRLVCVTDNKDNPAAEAYHLLGFRLRGCRQKRQLKKVMVTSTIPQEGKSVCAANLGCTLASRATQNTLIIEGDLRRPAQSGIFGIQSTPGLSEYLRGEQELSESIYHLEGTKVWLMPAGNNCGNPLEILQTSRLAEMMDQVANWFEWIVIDAPPILPFADASIWMRLADGVLLVARHGFTKKRQLMKGLDALDYKKLIGAVLNCSTNIYRDDYYYSKKTDPDLGPTKRIT